MLKRFIYGLFLPFIIASTSLYSANDQRNWSNVTIGASGGAGALTLIAWANLQHAYSKMAHQRYPLMLKRDALTAALQEERDVEKRAELENELQETLEQMEAIEAARSIKGFFKNGSLLMALAAFAGAYYGSRKRTQP